MAKLIDIDNLSRFWENAKDYIDSRIDSRVGGAIYDNVMIAYHALSDSYSRHAKLETWPDLQASGETADGVFLNDGGKSFIIAPDTVSLYWSSEAADQGGGIFRDSSVALTLFDGREQTAAHLEYEACRGEDYANGYCNAYSRLNAQGYGYAAGEWWLPSLGELELIFANLNAVQYALSLIDGATPIPSSNHWSSTQANNSTIWRVGFRTQMFGETNKTSSSIYVRPVTSFNVNGYRQD